MQPFVAFRVTNGCNQNWLCCVLLCAIDAVLLHYLLLLHMELFKTPARNTVDCTYARHMQTVDCSNVRHMQTLYCTNARHMQTVYSSNARYKHTVYKSFPNLLAQDPADQSRKQHNKFAILFLRLIYELLLKNVGIVFNLIQSKLFFLHAHTNTYSLPYIFVVTHKDCSSGPKMGGAPVFGNQCCIQC